MGRHGDTVVSVRASSQRLRRTAESQLEASELSDERIEVRIRGTAEAVSQAMELRRWGGSGPSRDADPPSIGVVAVDGDPAAAAARAWALARQAEPGQIRICARLAAAGELPAWLALHQAAAGSELESVGCGWAAGGARAPLPLPGAIAAAVDRPWPLLGRRAELDSIAASWHRVVGGGSAVHMIAGEMGSGKTRLVAEASQEIHRAGGLVLHGNGGGPEDAPYAPFVEALAHLAAHGDDILPSGFADSTFAGLLPGSSAPAGRGSGGGLGDERAALFGAAVRDFGELSARVPMLLVVDDLHACGSSSLRLLGHLARSGLPIRLMILATYRPTDVDPADERAGAIGALRSAPAASHVDLGGLDQAAIRGIAAAMGVADDDAALDAAASAANRETSGNPLLASEILLSIRERGALPAERTTLPRSLRMLIAARANALGERTYGHLCAAAVAGRRFDPSVVAEALGVPAGELADSMARGERAGLVSTVPDGSYLSFSHEVTASCLYEETSAAHRGRLHRRLAEAIEARGHLNRDAAPLALHWRRAEPADPARALRFSGIAGEQALERGDHDGGAAWFERALQIHAGMADAGVAERCDLLLGLGTALRFSGEARFREILLEAGRLAEELDDTDRLVAAALANNRGFNSTVGDFDRERVSMLELAAQRIGAARSPMLALVLAQLALELTFSPQLERRHELATEALAIAREGGDDRVLARVLIRGLIARWGPGNAAERVADAGRAATISAAADEQLDLFHGLYWQSVARVELGHLTEAARALTQQRRIAETIGDRTASWLCECSTSLHSALHGRLHDAEASAQAALESAQESAQPDALSFYVSQLASIRWQQGRLQELTPLLTEALRQNPGLPSFRSLVCLSLVLAGERQEALDVLAIDLAGNFSELPVDPTWIAATTTYAHAIAELGSRQGARALEPIIAPYAGSLASTSISAWGLVDHALGRLRLMLGDRAEGERLLDRAMTGYARIAAPVWRAQAGLDLVGDLRAGGFAIEGRRYAEAIEDAARIGKRHGAGLLIRDHAEVVAVGAVDQPGLEQRLLSLNLTERQIEVVRLVAGGCSNVQIAAELEISKSTVKRHLENIAASLRLRGRRELTAMLLEGEGPDRA